MYLIILAICLLFSFAPAMAQTDSTAEKHERRIRPAAESSYSHNFERWAIIVGISKYKYSHWNLQYAHRDADSLYRLIQTPSGGGFKKDHIKIMIDSAATTANITRALRGFLKKPAREDLVLIYFACHGGPDADRPETLYLITHDTDPDDIAGSALPMREVNLSLRENLLAERVVVIADVCHSASIGTTTRRLVIDSAAVMNTYLRNTSKAKGGIALLTSAESKETAQEDKKWGGGHGVFTYYLLEGMRGNADVRSMAKNKQKDGIVTVGELFEYVRENVKNATDNQQHPFIGPEEFDRDLPMAISGGITAQEHYQLGCQLYEMGLQLDDKKRFESANHQFDEALRLISFSDGAVSEVNLMLGRSLLALGKYSEAVQVLQAANKDQKHPEAFFYAGVGEAKQQHYQAAAPAFTEFLKQRPQDEYARHVKEYTDWLANRQKTGKKYALLIGSGEFAADAPATLVDRPHDVQLMKQVLVLQHGFQDSNIVTLIGKNATVEGILSAFDRFSHAITINDTMVIFLSSRTNTAEMHFLHLHGSMGDSSGGRQAISADDLHYLIEGIPTTHKTVILDAAPLPQLLSRARKDGGYALFMAATPGQLAHPHPDFKEKTVGAFTYALVKKLRELPSPKATFGQIEDAVIQEFNNDSTRARYGAEQTPLFIGNRASLLFTGEDYYLGLFDFVQRKNFTAMTPKFLEQKYQWFCRQVVVPFPAVHYNFGRAFLEKGNYVQAQQAIQTAIKQRDGKYPEAQLTLGILQVYMQKYAEGLASFKNYLSTLTSDRKAQMQKPVALIETLARPRKHALLIGIDDYAKPELADLRGAMNDVQTLRTLLIERCGFQKENIKMLVNRQATRQAILQTFTALTEKARRHEPALFYFAGYGSKTIYGYPTIVSADGRQAGISDIPIHELSNLVPANANLLTVIDAGCAATTTGNRSLAADKQLLLDDARPVNDRANRYLGLISIYPGTMSADPQPEIFDLEFPYTEADANSRFHGELTWALVQSLKRADPLELTYAQLHSSTAEQIFKPSLQPVVFGESLQRKLFSHSPALADTIHALVTNIEKFEAIDEAIRILERLNDQRNDIYPEGHVNLGIAYAAKGDYQTSISFLEEASVKKSANYRSEAHYYLGLALLESGSDLEKAASELRQAIQEDPDNIPAHYYFGKTIRALIDRGLLEKAEEHWQKYLYNGAPLGFDDEVQDFLDSRQAEKQPSSNIKK